MIQTELMCLNFKAGRGSGFLVWVVAGLGQKPKLRFYNIWIFKNWWRRRYWYWFHVAGIGTGTTEQILLTVLVLEYHIYQSAISWKVKHQSAATRWFYQCFHIQRIQSFGRYQVPVPSVLRFVQKCKHFFFSNCYIWPCALFSSFFSMSSSPSNQDEDLFVEDLLAE